MSDTISHEDVDEAIRLVGLPLCLPLFRWCSAELFSVVCCLQTHASKYSLEDSTASSREDHVAAIFSILCDLATASAAMASRKTGSQAGGGGAGGLGSGSRLPYAQVEATVLKKGFTAAQLQNCLHEYDQLGVISIDSDRHFITLDN